MYHNKKSYARELCTSTCLQCRPVRLHTAPTTGDNLLNLTEVLHPYFMEVVTKVIEME